MQGLSIKEQFHPSLIWQEGIRKAHQLGQTIKQRFTRATQAFKERLAVASDFSRFCEGLLDLPKPSVRTGVLEGFLICLNRSQSVALYQGDNLFRVDEAGRLVGEVGGSAMEESNFLIRVRDGEMTLTREDREQAFCSNEEVTLGGSSYLIKLLPSVYQRKVGY